VLAIALLLQLQAAQTAAPEPQGYPSEALRKFIARAALANRAPPPTLHGYSAKVETEMAFILRDSIGREDVGQIEQLAALAEWARDGRYDLRVVGYRAQMLGAPYSALTFTRMFTTPVLYGNRLAVGMNDGLPRTRQDSAARRRRLAQDSARGLQPFRAIHPLSSERDRFYRFTGGDTVAAIIVSGRTVRVLRTHAHPIKDPQRNYIGFEGELDFDVDRHQLVRMRGRFVEYTTRKDPAFIRATGAIAIAFIEFENAEIAGRYWLPAVQRSEFQAQMGALGDVRPIYRIVTRFRDYNLGIGDTTVAEDPDTVLPQIPPIRARLTFAPSDSVNSYGAWEDNIGAKISSVGGGDFEDLAPDVWRPTGVPTLSYWPKRVEDVVRYNRVEGMFTGVSGTVRMRDAFPGLTVRGMLGVGWESQDVRGSLNASLSRGRWIQTARAERALAVTNDFMEPFATGLSIWPLFSATDEADFVDRYTAAYSVTRVIKDVDRALLTGEFALVRDRPEVARLVNGVSATGGQHFLPNRGALPGDYARGTVTLEYHPRVTGIGLSPGVGARVACEIAAGQLDWQRLDVRLTARRYWHGLLFASRVDGGIVTGDVLPPQVMYEVGGGLNLPAYEYKEFGGDRAAAGRALVAYYLPFMRAPKRFGRLILPGLSPGIGAGINGGWAEVSNAAASTAMSQLVGGVAPIPTGTGRVRASADVRLTVLSGLLGFGMARPLDHQDGWKFFFVWGAGY